ncbi:MULTISPECIES: hypothetical protein [Pseudonocardia]|nr:MULTISPECIES: hypothetical protein [Pseudonocardia]
MSVAAPQAPLTEKSILRVRAGQPGGRPIDADDRMLPQVTGSRRTA